MEISYLECQLVNAGRKEFSQWVANSLGSRSWGRERERSNIRIRIILIDPSSLLAQGTRIYTLLFYPFPFSVWSLWLFCARSLDNGVQQKLQEEILLQQNDQGSNIWPPFWIHCTLSVSTSQNWGYGTIAVCKFLCVSGYLEGSSGTLCYILGVVCSACTAWLPSGCAAKVGTFSDFQETADLDMWILQLIVMSNILLTILFPCLQQSTSYWTSLHRGKWKLSPATVICCILRFLVESHWFKSKSQFI